MSRKQIWLEPREIDILCDVIDHFVTQVRELSSGPSGRICCRIATKEVMRIREKLAPTPPKGPDHDE